LLTTIGASPALLAGCSSDSDTEQSGVTGTQRQAEISNTPSQTEQDESYKSPNGRLYRSKDALTDDFVAAQALAWSGYEQLRYWDEDSGSLQETTPQNDWFLFYSVMFKNVGGSPVSDLYSIDDVAVWNPNGTYSVEKQYPENLSEDKLRAPINEGYTADFSFDLSPSELSETMEPNRLTVLEFLFDVPKPEGKDYVVEWDPDTTIDDSLEPVYLAPVEYDL
jgi:hypothetical protein